MSSESISSDVPVSAMALKGFVTYPELGLPGIVSGPIRYPVIANSHQIAVRSIGAYWMRPVYEFPIKPNP